MTLKEFGILKTGRVCGGLSKKNGSRSAIPVVCGIRKKKLNHRNVNRNNLVSIPPSLVSESIGNQNAIATNKYAVSKCMFLNICSLTKFRNKIKANVALEADLFANDINICVISETHLKKSVPDPVVAISNYTIYRRDQNWFGNDTREKGGIAIC